MLIWDCLLRTSQRSMSGVYAIPGLLKLSRGHALPGRSSSNAASLGQDLRWCSSNKPTGDAEAAGLWTKHWLVARWSPNWLFHYLGNGGSERMREKASGLLHHQLDKSLGARIALTFAHLCVSLCWRLPVLLPLHPSCIYQHVWPEASQNWLASSNLVCSDPDHMKELFICLHSADPSGTFLKILLEVAPCWKWKLNQGQNGWIVPKRSISFEQNSFIYTSLAVGG